jgi:hypothetical protein
MNFAASGAVEPSLGQTRRGARFAQAPAGGPFWDWCCSPVPTFPSNPPHKRTGHMTTKTITQADDLPAIEEQLQTAREERSRLGQEARVFADKLAGLQAEFSGIARRDATQFGPDGQPKAKSRAAELKTEITKASGGHQWAALIEGADARIRELEHELTRALAANAEALARAEYEGAGQAAVEKLRQGAALILEGCDEYTASADRQGRIANSVAGLDGQDIVADPVVDEARRAVHGLGGAQPPRSKSLTPLVDDQPRKLRMVAGGYADGYSLRDEDVAEDQPERVEPI